MTGLDAAAETVAADLAAPRRMLVGDAWVDALSGATLTTEDPATGRTITTVPAGDAQDVDRAVRAARATFTSRVWRGTPGPRRAEVLWRFSDLVVEHVVELVGPRSCMPAAFARALITSAVDGLRYYAERQVADDAEAGASAPRRGPDGWYCPASGAPLGTDDDWTAAALLRSAPAFERLAELGVRSRAEDEAAAVVLDEFVGPACGTLLRSRIRVEPRTQEASA